MASKSEKKTTTLARGGARPSDIMTQQVAIAPQWIAQQGPLGTEEIERQDIILPRLGLCQSMTPQRKTSSPLFIEGLREGDLFNTLTGAVYRPPVQIVALFMYKTRILFNPLEAGGGIDCQSFNARVGGRLSPASCEACSHSQWSVIDTAKGRAAHERLKPDCNLFYNYPCLILPSSETLVLSFKSTGIKVARKWNSIVRLYGQNIMFSRYYELGVQLEKNKSGEWYNISVVPKDWVPEAMFNSARQMLENLRARPLRVDTRGLDTEPASPEEPSGSEM